MNCRAKSESCKLCVTFEHGIFAELSEKEIKELDTYRTTNHYKKKQTIFYEGNPALGLFCIRTGKIKLYKSSPDGKQQILRILKSGDTIGQSSLFSNQPLQATAEAIEDSEVCFLDKTGFLLILKNNSSVALKLLRGLSQELIQAEGKALDLAYKSARVRFAELLLTFKEAFGVSEKGSRYLNISLSREELAQTVGTTVETLVRLLSEFRKDGLIEVDKRNISILEPEKLLELTSSGY